MRKVWIYATQIVVSLAVCGLAIGCAVSSPTSTPSSTKITSEENVATAEDMWVSNVGNVLSSMLGGEQYSPYNLVVELKPTKSALPDQKYLVELYENGKYRDTTAIAWNQPELNVLKEKLVSFPITSQEFDAYFMEDISHIFSVKVVGKSPQMDERQWERIIEDALH